ncbi:ion transporter [Planctomycetales bacterium ZRK34]|nr:ion transporter [Planctomycetales bacterium ZRK34]
MAPWRLKLHTVIFEADTPAGKAFDVGLLIAIVLSVICVMLDSVEDYAANYHRPLIIAEWIFTIAFTIEYVLRLICVARPGRYALSFFGLVDLGSILPTYLSLMIPGAEGLLVIRSLRLLRVFRVLKLARFLSEASALRRALIAARPKVVVFLVTILILVCILGAAMHLIEGEASGFTSIPRSVYWAIVTVTTVGYGDIAPQTPLGQFLAAVAIIIGYSLIIVPTGILSAELSASGRREVSTQVCTACAREGHDADAAYCKYCGTKL